jgi:signal transduction histidine kinase/ActR/RegA family two-component response regulator
MKSAPLPPNESERLQELLSLEILDTETEDQFEEIVQLASHICQTPISLVTLIDEARQWFKARKGLPIQETPREVAFCSHAILQDDLFVVEDTSQDERFQDNPLVTGDPNIRFYAGFPLKTSRGYNIGTLCIIDTEKKTLTAEQRTALQLLARQVVKELELRMANRELVQTLEKLRQTETLLSEAENLAKTGGVKYNLRTRHFTCSTHLYNLLAIPAATPLADFPALLSYVAAEDQARIRACWDLAVSEGKESSIVTRLATDEQVWLEFRFRNVHRAGDHPVVIGTLQDITEAKKTEQLIIAEKAKAEQAVQAKSEFISVVSHEMRTPLNAIMGLTYLLMEEAKLPAEQQENLRSIHFSSQNLLALINDTLDLSKIESGKIELETINFPLKNLLKNIHHSLHLKAAEKGLDFQLFIDPEIPAEVTGDPIRLTQILTNLAGNAIKFTAKGSVTISVEVLRSLDTGWELEFSVTDTGIGIPPERQQRIFESYVQADASTQRQYGGTGLGLTITKKLVELQQGTITVASIPGKGSRFSVRIPYGKPTAISRPKVSRATDQVQELPGARILVVDDNAINQFVAKKVLTRWKVIVYSADNGSEALRKVENTPLDLILMDLQMPVMDGMETIRQLRKSGFTLPVIAFTANESEAEKQQVLAAGGNDYQTKPYKPQELFEKLHWHLYPDQRNGE